MTSDEMWEKLRSNAYVNHRPYASLRENKAAHEAYEKEELRIRKEFEQDCHAYIVTMLNMPVSDKQFATLFNMAWDKGHGSGLQDVFSEVMDLVDIASVFVTPHQVEIGVKKMPRLKFKWKKKVGQFASGESLYANSIKIASYTWNIGRNRNDPPGNEYIGNVGLPGLKVDRAYARRPEEIKPKIESVVAQWFEEALKESQDA